MRPTRGALIAAGKIVGREFALDSESWREWEERRGGERASKKGSELFAGNPTPENWKGPKEKDDIPPLIVWGEVKEDGKEYLRPRYAFYAQKEQYPATGKPGINYFKGVLSEETRTKGPDGKQTVTPARHVDCLLWRDDKGEVRGILNHYPEDMYSRVESGMYRGMRSLVQRKGDLNILVDPEWQGKGIATALVDAALERFKDINFAKHTFTADGRKFITKYVQQRRARAAKTGKQP